MHFTTYGWLKNEHVFLVIHLLESTKLILNSLNKPCTFSVTNQIPTLVNLYKLLACKMQQ
jgi:hypothetical protein